MAYITDKNGNYKRTVTCGHCYETGHNRSGCADLKKKLVENIAEYKKRLEADDFTDDWQRRNAQRRLADAEHTQHKMLNKGKNRKCGFCKSPGHTRRTCPDRKVQVATKMKETTDFRRQVAARMIEAGFGPGALISTNHRHADHGEQALAIVTGISLGELVPQHKVQHDGYFYGMEGVRFQFVSPVKDSWSNKDVFHGSCMIPLEYCNVDGLDKEEWYRTPSGRFPNLLSCVEITEDQLLPPEVISEKAVSRYVLENIVDPK